VYFFNDLNIVCEYAIHILNNIIMTKERVSVMRQLPFNTKIIILSIALALLISLSSMGVNLLFAPISRLSFELLLLSTLISSLINYSAWSMIYNYVRHQLEDVLEDVKTGNFREEACTTANSTSLLTKDIYETLNTLQTNMYKDELTGLPNRQALIQYFNNDIKSNDERLHYITLFDVDNFKTINDTYGHNIGDEVLITISQRSNSILLPNERLFRLGGDEFVLVSSLKRDEQHFLYTTKLQAMFRYPFDIQGVEMPMDISFGTSEYGIDGMELKTLMMKADEAMYANKNSKKYYKTT